MTDKRYLSEGVLLAAAPAAAYAIAYAYKGSYGAYFGVPPILITPSLGQVLKAGGVIASVLLPFWLIAAAVWPFVPSEETAVGRTIQRTFLLAILLAVVIFTMSDGWKATSIFIGIALLYCAIVFGFPLAFHRTLPTLEEKHQAQERIDMQTKDRALVTLVTSKLGTDALLLICIAAVLIPLASAAGRKAASTQEVFFTLEGQTSAVVVEIEDNTAVLAHYDKASHVLSGEYRVVRLGDSSTWVLRSEKVGRLKAK